MIDSTWNSNLLQSYQPVGGFSRRKTYRRQHINISVESKLMIKKFVGKFRLKCIMATSSAPNTAPLNSDLRHVILYKTCVESAITYLMEHTHFKQVADGRTCWFLISLWPGRGILLIRGHSGGTGKHFYVINKSLGKQTAGVYSSRK